MEFFTNNMNTKVKLWIAWIDGILLPGNISLHIFSFQQWYTCSTSD